MTDRAQGASLVTGAGVRIGAAIARELAVAGRPVAVHHHGSAEAAEALAHGIEAAGGRAATLAADLGDEAQVETLIARAEAALGPVTLLVNNAAVFDLDLWDTADRASWDRHMEINLRAPFVLAQTFARAAFSREGEGEAIVNLIDQRVRRLTPMFMSYTVSKMGLWTLTRTLAMALGPRIRVNGVGPGPILPSARQDRAHFEAQVAATVLKRAASPEEIAKTVRFLAEAPTVTGEMIAVDGGQNMVWRGEDLQLRE